MFGMLRIFHITTTPRHAAKRLMRKVYLNIEMSRHRVSLISSCTLNSQPYSAPYTWLIGVLLWSKFQFMHWILLGMFVTMYQVFHRVTSAQTLKRTSLIDKNMILPPCPYMVWFPCSLSWPGPLAFLIGCSCLLSPLFSLLFFFF